MIKKLLGLCLAFGLLIPISFAEEETTSPPEEIKCHFHNDNEDIKNSKTLPTLTLATDEWANFQVKANGIWVEYNAKIHDKTLPFRWEKIDGKFSAKTPNADAAKFLCPHTPTSTYSNEKNPYAFGNETYNKNQCRLQLGKVMQRCQAEKNAVLVRKNDRKSKWETETKTENIATAYENLGKELDKIREKFKADSFTWKSTSSDFKTAIADEQYAFLKKEFEIRDNQVAATDATPENKKQTIDVLTENFLVHFSYLQKQSVDLTDYVSKLEHKSIKEANDELTETKAEKFEDVDEISIATDRIVQSNQLDQINAKIHLLEKRISTLTQSLFISGSSQFEVSQLLNSTTNDGAVSNEGNLRIIKSYDEEIFCADITNRETNADQWQQVCNNNLFDKLIRLVSQIIGTVGVILIIVAVVMLITANGDESQLDKGKKLILYTLAGLLIFFMSFIIVQFIIDLLVW